MKKLFKGSIYILIFIVTAIIFWLILDEKKGKESYIPLD